MKKALVILTLICMTFAVSAQKKDGLKDVPKTYVSASISPFTQAGIFENKTSGALEVGIRAFHTNVGIAVGTTTLNNGNGYIELRVSPTLWEKGKFSVSGTLGGGYVFNNSNFLMEYGGSVNYAIIPSLSLSAGYGAFNFTGKSTLATVPFSRFGLTYSF